MQINDNLYFSDSGFHGYVIARDQDNNIIFQKHNMVVAGGREAIIQLLANSCGVSNNNENNAFKEFSAIRFGSGINMTTLDTTDLTSREEKYKYEIGEDAEIKVTFKVASRKIEFNVTVSTSEPAELSELGLYFKDNNNSEHLFSRVVFDPIFCGANAAVTSFTLTYYVYL